MHAAAVDHRIRTRKINVFKHAERAICFAAVIGDRTHAVFLKNDDLTRLDVADKFRAHRIQRTAFGCDYISPILRLAVTERPKTVLIAHRDQLGRRQDHQRIRTPDARHRLIDCLLDRRRVQSFLGDDIGNDLRIAGRGKDRALQFQFAPELFAVDDIAVMRQGHSALDMVDHDRLRVAAVIASGRAVTHMSDRHIALAEAFQDLRRKHVVDQSGVFIRLKQSVIIDNDAARFLPAVLQRKQSVISGARHIGSFRGKYAEHTAFFS